MSKKPATTEPKRDHVVVRIMRRGLSTYHHLHGPFTEAEANAYAMHGNRYEGDEYYVEDVQPIQHHEKWIFRGIQTGR